MELNRAAALIAAARLTAGLTQTRLADLAGTTQPTISAYERGAKVPDLATLERILDAAGFELRMSLAPADDHDRSLERYERTLPAASRRGVMSDTPLGRRLRRHRRAVIHCAEVRGAHNVRVFGSVARGEDTAASDVDLLVDLDPHQGLVALAGLTRELSDLLRVRVDVVPASSLKAAIRAEVFAEAVPL